MPVGPVRKSYGGAPDRRALVTDKGVNEGIGCTLTATNFTGKPGVVDGLVPALYPIVVDAAGKATVFVGTAGAKGKLSGFTLNPVDISGGDDITGYMNTGDIDVTKLPVTLDPAAVDAASSARFYFDAKA